MYHIKYITSDCVVSALANLPQLVFEVTDACNLRCKYCAYGEFYTRVESQCSKCRNCKACIQCIFNLENIDNKPVCYGYMNEQNFQNYVNQQMHFLEKHPEAYKKIMEEVYTV